MSALAPAAHAGPADDWSPTPKHVLRMDCVRALSAGWRPGRFIEFGAGVGVATLPFLERGFRGLCCEPGEANRAALQRRLGHFGDAVAVAGALPDEPPASFDYLFAFEVLEHIEEDAAALASWTRYLRPGGRALVSVPAHQRKFGPDDEAVGHVRRYEKAQLAGLFARCGYGQIRVVNYGFPLGNLTRLAGTLLRRAERDPGAAASRTERSVHSGGHRPRATRALSFLFRRGVLAPFVLLQPAFFDRDWGDGYVLSAVKPE